MLRVTSPNFQDQQSMPHFTLCPTWGGQNRSPALHWTKVPGVKSYALLCYDPDAFNAGGTGFRTWIHWFIPYIPPQIDSLPSMKPINQREIILNFQNQRTPRGYLIQGINSWGSYGWGGPCPSVTSLTRLHHYYFIIYALDTVIDGVNRDGEKGDAKHTLFSNDSVDFGSLKSQLRHHTIAIGSLMGTFFKQ